jgi:DNA-binding transcriptional regulator GbsR (MarR family)
MPIVSGRKDISASVWLGYDGISKLTGLPKSRISEAMSKMRDEGIIEERLLPRQKRIRALTDKSIKLIEEYSVGLTVTEVVIDPLRKSVLTVTEVVTDRDRDKEKIDSSREAATRHVEIAGKLKSSTTKKNTTTKFSLSGFYDSINNLTGTALPTEKNQAFQTMLNKHGRDNFAYALSELSNDGVKFVWTETAASNEFDYNRIPDLFDVLLKDRGHGAPE